MASRSRSRSSSSNDERDAKRRRRSDKERYAGNARDGERHQERDRGKDKEDGRRRRRERSRSRSKDRRSGSGSRDRHGRKREARTRDRGHASRRREQEGKVRVKEEDESARRSRDLPRRREEEQSVLTGANADQEEKQGPDFAVSGKLLEDTNVFNGVVVKYAEPPEARRCKKRWRFYVFKGDDVVSTLHMHRQSAYLIGKDRKVADLPIDHPSCSRQHAVLQYRAVKGRGVLPYVMDLGSSNGTYLNNSRIESKRYYELREKDMIKFGYSSREYVLLHEHSRDQDGQSDEAGD